MRERSETWYDRQAMISKLLTYVAILMVLGSIGWGLYVAYLRDLHQAMIFIMAGTATAAFLAGFSAIIDLMIVHAEALHDLRK